MNYTIKTYQEQYVPEIVDFWNETFSDRHNFFPITEDIFHDRITSIETNMEEFDPDHYLVAIEEDSDNVLGIIHVGIHPEEFCYTWYGDNWGGGVQGYVGMIAVHPDYRQQGIGTALWEKGMERLDHCENIIIDGQCINPYYGNSLGPFQPFWGTTEGVSISPEQRETLTFFTRRGFTPRYAGVTLQLPVEEANLDQQADPSATVKILDEEYPALDNPADMRLPYPDAEDYFVTQIIEEDQTAGLLSVYPMTHLDDNKWGIYEFQVHKNYQGKGYGTTLLQETIKELQNREATICETFSLKEVSEEAMSLYQSFGFEQQNEWVIF